MIVHLRGVEDLILVNEIPPQPSYGDRYVVAGGGNYIVQVEAATLGWTLVFNPIRWPGSNLPPSEGIELKWSGSHSKVTAPVYVPAGPYQLMWAAKDVGNFIVQVHWSDGRTDILVNQIPPNPSSGETFLDSSGGFAVIEIGAARLSWAMGLRPLWHAPEERQVAVVGPSSKVPSKVDNPGPFAKGARPVRVEDVFHNMSASLASKVIETDRRGQVQFRITRSIACLAESTAAAAVRCPSCDGTNRAPAASLCRNCGGHMPATELEAAGAFYVDKAWWIDVREEPTLHIGYSASPHLLVTMDEVPFLDLVAGRLPTDEAFGSGLIRLDGDLTLAPILHQVLASWLPG